MKSNPALLGIYRPGNTFLHRLSAGQKLLLLFTFGVVVVVVRGPASAIGFLVFTLVLVAWSGMRIDVLLRTLRGLLLIAGLLFAYHVWRTGWDRGIEAVADLTTLILASTILTTTTPIDEMLDTITASMRPFQRFGANPERIALTFALLIRAIPETLEIASETRDAAKARGLERNPRVYMTPLAIRVVANARDTGDALAARGIGDD